VPVSDFATRPTQRYHNGQLPDCATRLITQAAGFTKAQINLLQSSGFFTYHQVEHSEIIHGASFRCFVRISEQTATFVSCNINWLVFITVVESVYNSVRTDSLYKADYVSSLKVISYALCLQRTFHCKGKGKERPCTGT